MAIAIGNNQFTQIGQIKIGNNNVQRVYRGNDLIFPLGPSFGTGFNATVLTVAIQSDSKIVIGGAFTAYQGTTSNRIIRLNVDGSIDTSFNIGTGFNNQVRSVAIQSDNKVIVCGDFTAYNGTTSNRIIRLNTDGSLDTSFNVGTGFNNFTESVAIQSDSKIIIGGTFTAYQGTTSNYIIRLNTNGSIDTSFTVGTGFTASVLTVVIQSDSKIVIGGAFTAYNGTTSNYIIRLNSNGSVDTSFNVGTGFNSNTRSVAIQSDSKIVVVGDFTAYNGTTSNYIIRLNSNGSVDTSFNVGTGFNNLVLIINIQPDGKILTGGTFTAYNGTTSNRIIRLNSNGSVDTSFNVGTGFNSTVRAISLRSNTNIIVGGFFIQYNGITANRIVELLSDGTRLN